MMSTTTTTGNNSSVLPSKRLVPPANLFQPQQKPPLGSSGEYPYPFTRQYNHHNQQQQQQQRQYATPQQTDLSAGGINPSSSDNNSPSLTPPSSQSMTDPQQLPYTLGTLAAGGDDRRNSTISVLSMHSFGSGMTGEQKPNGLISRQQSSSIEDLAAVLSLPNQRDQQTAEAINALVSLTGTVPLTAAQQQQQKQQQQQQEKQRRHRRKFDEVERLFRCNFGTCQKSYGTLNHLNHHIVLQGHGPKRKPSEFPEIRRYLKEKHRHSSQIASADISDTASEPSLPQPLQSAQLQQQ
jgi:hypothetical protein